MGCLYPIKIATGLTSVDRRVVTVPCGKCPECKQRRLNSWVFRLKHHLRAHKYSCFLTLTYEDSYLPVYLGVLDLPGVHRNPGAFELYGVPIYPTLVKSDLQKFFKRLRKKFRCKDEITNKYVNPDISYYAIGEYGGHNARPHYHVLLFSNTIDVSSLDYSWFWHFGFFKVEPVHFESLKYVAKHHLEPKDYNNYEHCEKPFSLRSKKLGITFVTDKVVRYYKSNPVPVVNIDGYRHCMPRYIREKLTDAGVEWPGFVPRYEPSPFDSFLQAHPGMDIACAYRSFEQYVSLKEKRNLQKSKSPKL